MKTKHPLHLILRGPKARETFHGIMSYLWLLAMVIIPFLPTFRTWSNPSTLAALLIMEVSLYANFSTEYGAIDSATAAAATEISADNITITSRES